MSDLTKNEHNEKFLVYLVYYDGYLKSGGGITGKVNEAIRYTYKQMVDVNLPNTIALFINPHTAKDLEGPHTKHPWELIDSNIPDTLPSRSFNNSDEEISEIKLINKVAHEINRMEAGKDKDTLILAWVKLYYKFYEVYKDSE